MSSDDRAEVLERSLSQVLEEAAFCFSEPVSDPEEWEGSLSVAALELSGAGRGRLSLAIPCDYATELAANLLGLEPGDAEADEKAADAVGELLNIVAGAMMPELFGADALVDLSAPRVETLDSRAWSEIADAASVAVSLRVDEITRVDFVLSLPAGSEA